MNNIPNITPAIFCKNEEYWIHWVLRDLLDVFEEVILLDTGSTDNTKKIAKATAAKSNGVLTLIEHKYFEDANKIGNSPNLLRELVKTEFMLLIGGDEIWPKNQLLKLGELEIPENLEVGMLLGRNLIHTSNGWYECEGFNADRLFTKDVKWHTTNYPYEAHGLQERIQREVVHYFDPFFWHARHLKRSKADNDTFYRKKKMKYYKPHNLKLIPQDWFGSVNGFKNPYIGV